MRQEVVTERGSKGERNDQRCENGNDISDAERHEYLSLNAAHRKQRYEHQNDDDGRKDNGAPNLN